MCAHAYSASSCVAPPMVVVLSRNELVTHPRRLRPKVMRVMFIRCDLQRLATRHDDPVPVQACQLLRDYSSATACCELQRSTKIWAPVP